MQATRVLKVTADEFFNEIVRSILLDIQRNSNKKLHATQIKPGLRYKKKLHRRFFANAEVTIKVLECVRNRIYASAYQSNLDITTTRYEITELPEDRIEVTYTEEYSLLHHGSSSRFINGRMMNKTADRKGDKLLRHIEGYIVRNRDKQGA